MELSNSILRNPEPILRLAGWAGIYLIVLIVLRAVFWPWFMRVRQQSQLDVVVRRIFLRLLRFLIALMLCGVFTLSALVVTGRGDTFGIPGSAGLRDLRTSLADTALPTVDRSIIVLLVLFVLALIILARSQPWVGKQ